MRKVSASETHQGWIDEESLAARPGIVMPVIRVSNRWLERAARSIHLLEREWGRPVRFMHVSGSVQVLFRGGAVMALVCPLSVMTARAYSEALREALATKRRHTLPFRVETFVRRLDN